MKLVGLIAVVAVLCGSLAAQEIDVQRPAGQPIPSGSQDNVGSKTGLGAMTLTYTIMNTDVTPLDLIGATPVTATSPNNIIFTLTQPASNQLQQNETTTFPIEITPAGDGAFAVNLTIANNDADEGSYLIRIRGNTGTEKKDDDDCSTSEGTRGSFLLALGAVCAVGVGLRLRRSRA